MGTFFWISGILSIANWIWMLLVPESWYQNLPAGVPDTGPFNHHFVQDVGAAYTTVGVALALAAARPRYRRSAILFAALFFALHAAVHVADLSTGRLHGDHWLIDFPGVFLPAIILVAICLMRWREL